MSITLRLRRFVMVFASATMLVGQSFGSNQSIETACARHMSELTDSSLDHDHLDGIRFASLPKEAHSEARKSFPATVSVMNNLPRNNQEFAAIYGREVVTPAIEAELLAVRQAEKDSPPARSPGSHTMSEDFPAQLKASSTGIFIIMGHNRGGRFVFRDGSTRGLEDMAEECLVSVKLCVFVSCRSQQFIGTLGLAIGVSHPLTFTEALDISSQFQKYVRSSDLANLSAESLRTVLSQQESHTRYSAVAVYILIKVCHTAVPVIAVALLVQSLQKCDSKHSHCGVSFQ